MKCFYFVHELVGAEAPKRGYDAHGPRKAPLPGCWLKDVSLQHSSGCCL